MKEPRRLNRSGGASQRLLDSASIDKPGPAARRHAASLASTASAFARTSRNASGVIERAGRRAHPAKTLAVWITVGAAASVALGLVGSKLLDAGGSRSAAVPLATLSSVTAAAPVPALSPEIAAEPALAHAPSRPSAAPPDELGAIDAARAALARGDAAGAIMQLDRHDQAHPNGQLEPESMALRIRALSKSGKDTEARALANELRAKYPEYPLGR